MKLPKAKTTFEIGFEAFCRGLPCDPSQPQEWQNGWLHAQAVEQEVLTTA
jgi:hypothetical protein